MGNSESALEPFRAFPHNPVFAIHTQSDTTWKDCP